MFEAEERAWSSEVALGLVLTELVFASNAERDVNGGKITCGNIVRV